METIVFTVRDLMNRYRVSDTVARKMMREIKDFTQSVMPKGRCLKDEAFVWERRNLNKKGAENEN